VLTTFIATLALAFQVQTITYKTPAKSIGAVLADLSIKTHQKLEAVDFLSRQPIMVDVHDVGAAELLKRIAQCTYGKWITSNDVKKLVVDETAVASGRALLKASESKEIRFAVAEEQASVDSQDPISADSAQMFVDAFANQIYAVEAPRNDNEHFPPDNKVVPPTSRLAIELLGVVGPEAIQAIPNGDRVVFSTQPNKAQQPLPPSSEVIAQFLKDQQIWNQYMHSVPKVAGALHRKGDPPSFERIRSYIARGQEGGETIGKIDFALRREGEALYADLLIFDDKGNLSLEDDTVALGLKWGEVPYSLPGDKGFDNHKIPVSDRFRDFAAVTAEFGEDPKASKMAADKLTAQFHAQIMRPDLYDPMSFRISELLNGYAETKKLSLVAMLPDSEVEDFALVQPYLSMVDQALSKHVFAHVVKGAGWLQLIPKDPEDLHRRLDRNGLARLLATLSEPRASNVRAFGTFYLQSPWNDNFMMMDQLALANLPNGPSLFDSMDSPERKLAYEFYAVVGDAVRKRIMKGEEVPISELGPQIAGALANFLHMSSGEYKESLKAGAAYALGRDSEVDFPPNLIRFETGPDRPLTEPTEIFPDGVPLGSTLKMQIFSQPALIGADPGFSEAYYADTLDAQDSTERKDQILPSTFSLGDNTSIFSLIKLGTTTMALDCFDAVLRSTTTYKLSTVPRAFKVELKTAQKRVKGL
jgi:hypothetical protein